MFASGAATYTSNQGHELTISLGQPVSVQDARGILRPAYPLLIVQKAALLTEWELYLDGQGTVVRSEMRCTTYANFDCLQVRLDWHRQSPPPLGVLLPRYIDDGTMLVQSEDAQTSMNVNSRRVEGLTSYQVEDLPTEFVTGRNPIEGGTYFFAGSEPFPTKMTVRRGGDLTFVRTKLELGEPLQPIEPWPLHGELKLPGGPILFAGEDAELAAAGPSPRQLVEELRLHNQEFAATLQTGCWVGFGFDPTTIVPNRNGTELLLPESFQYTVDTLDVRGTQERWHIKWTESGIGPDNYSVEERTPISLGVAFDCTLFRLSPHGGMPMQTFLDWAKNLYGQDNVFRLEVYVAGQTNVTAAQQFGTMLFYGAYAFGDSGTGFRAFIQPTECRFTTAYVSPDMLPVTIPATTC